MTVQNLIVKNIASGNGSTTQWPFTFACPVDHPEYIKVYIKGASGKATATTDFSVNMTNKYITYPVTGSVLASGEKIIIARELPLHQILNLVNQGPFYAEDLEVTYDELVMMIQQLNEQLGRSLKVGVDIDSDSDIDVTIPVPTDNDVHSLVLDKNGFKLFSNPGDAAEYAATAQNAASVALEYKNNVVSIAGTNYNNAVKVLGRMAEAEENAKASENVANTKATEASASANSSQRYATIAQQQATKAQGYVETVTSVIDTSGVAGQVAKNTGDISSLTSATTVMVNPENWLDKENVTTGKYIGRNGIEYSNSAYNVTDYIPVKENDVVKLYRYENETSMPSEQIRFLCAYDSGKNPVADKGADSVYSYTVPSGIDYIRLSSIRNFTDTRVGIVKDGTPKPITTYFAPYKIPSDRDRVANLEARATVLENNYLSIPAQRIDVISRTGHDYMNDIVQDNKGKYWNKDQYNNLILNNNSTYDAVLIPITEQGIYRFSATPRFVEVVDANNKVLLHQVELSSVDTSNLNAKYLAVSIDKARRDSTKISLNDTPNKEQYTASGQWVFEYIQTEQDVIHCYLPKEICVGVGRTIELYNDLVCLEANKYHLDWTCSVGVDYARKFSVIGTTGNVGNYALTLRIYDNNLNVVKTLSSTLKIVANNIANPINIIPIGDSLTNSKAWLGEVKSLSNNKINYIGTRRGHEGRSGATSGWYIANSTYSFDSSYSGNPSVSSNVNPFWDGTQFSLQHYIDTQSSYVGTPNAIQLLLGINGIAIDATSNVDKIKTIVDSIQTEYPNMPIFVCNTIYRSNQNGYYSTGGDGYSSASDFQFSSDVKIMNLQNALAEAFDLYDNVYIVPLSICMDREYNFGHKEVTVNPRSTIVEHIPNESVHPQNAGYMQMADVMYSSYIAHLE